MFGLQNTLGYIEGRLISKPQYTLGTWRVGLYLSLEFKGDKMLNQYLCVEGGGGGGWGASFTNQSVTLLNLCLNYTFN